MSDVLNRSELSELEFLLENKDYTRVLNGIQLIRDSIGVSNWSISDKSRLLYYQARSLYNLGKFHSALIKIKSALRLSRKVLDDNLYASEKLTYGLICIALGRHAAASEAYLESYVFRKRAGTKELLYGPLLNLGLLKILTGELDLAKENCRRSLDLAMQHNSEAAINLCRQGYALSLWLRGELRALDVELASWGSLNRADLNTWRIWVIKARSNMFRLEFCSSIGVLCEAMAFYREKMVARDVAVCLEYLGLNEYFAGNYAKAREYYDQVLAMPEPTASAVAQTLRMLTDVEIAEGNWDAAKATAARADAAINKISERIELGALWRAYGQIHTHDNDHAKAREYFEKSIDLLRQLGARYELALSHFDAGRSKAYSVEAQIEQLKAAKALFVEMEVPKRVAQVDEALGKITNLKAGNPDKTKRSLTLKSAPAVPVVIAVSRSMSDIMELVERVKDRDMSVLITGETGTGKDLLAEYIHATGNRSGGPFMAINCAAVPENLLECELFGVKKGTYTGSTADKPGLIESADGGTFYFDEIGDAPAAIQSKLLRVIETKTVRRLGANDDVRVNVRFIAATNHNLQERIASKEFRRDLYYRLAEVEIGLPPLRERREDVMPLISRFLKTQDIELTTAQYGQLESRLNGYDWPGNVREVRHLVNLATLTNTNGDLIPALESALSMLNHPDVTESKAALIEMLERHQGNISGMARELGIPRTTLISQLKKFGLL